MRTPAITFIQKRNTHRLILSKYSVSDESVLNKLAHDEAHFGGIITLDDATNERLLAEVNRHPYIKPIELVSTIPNYRIINAAFTHTQPSGSRFNGPDRGAWYAGLDIETSKAEVAYHKSVQLNEVGHLHDSVTYDDYRSHFIGEFHDIRGNVTSYRKYLNPNSYKESQQLAQTLMQVNSSGIIYPSVRRSEGICIGCFRPALVYNVRKYARYRFTWSGTNTPKIVKEKIY